MAILAFLLRRSVAQRLLGLAVVVALGFTIGVLVAGPIYADSAREAILSSALRSEGVVAKNVRFTVYVGAGTDAAAMDATVRAATEGLPVGRIVPQSLASVRLRVGGGAELDIELLAREGAQDHLELEGAFPSDGEVALSSGLMRTLRLRLGNVIALAGPSGEEATLEVVGRYTAPAPEDAFWYEVLSPFPPPDSTQPSPLVMDPDALRQTAARLGLGTQLVWDVYLDLSRLPFERAERVPGLVASADGELAGTPGFSSLQTTTGIDTIMDLVRQRVENLRAPVLLVVFQIGAVALAVLLGVGSLVLTRQSFELAVLRSRGFSRGMLLAAQGGQALLSAVAALPLGLAFGMALAWLASSSNGPALPGVLFPIRMTSEAVAVGVATAALGAAGLLLLSIPHLRRTILEERRLLSREDRPLLARFPVELLVLPLGLFAFLELRRRGVTASLERGSFDPLVLLAPTLLIFGLSFVALRLLLLVLRAVDRRVRRTRRLPAYLAARRLGRSPGTSFATSLLLVLSVGLVLVSSSYRAVVARSHEDSAHQQVGSDWAITIAAPDQPLAAIERLPTGATPVVRSQPTFAQPAGPSSGAILLGVDPATFAAGGWWRDDYSDAPLRAWLEGLEVPSSGTPIGDGTIALAVDAPEEAAGLHLVAVAEASDGTVERLDLGTLAPGPRTYSAEIAGADRLLSIAFLQEGTEDLPAELPFTLSEATLGGEPLDLARWRPLRWRGSDATVADASGALTVAIRRGAGHVIGGLVPPTPPLPALASPGVASSQPQTFDATVGGQRLTFRRVAVAEHFPGVVGEFVVVSAPALLEATVRVPETGLGLSEVWAAGDDPRPELREAGFILGTARSARPIVGFLSQLPQSLAVGMYFTAAVGGLGLVVIGVAVGLYFAQRRREFEFAALRAMGTEPGQIRRTLALEQGLMVAYAVIAGGTIGYWILKLMMPYVGESLAAAFPTPLLALDEVSLGASIAAIATATAIGLALAVRALLRSSVTSVLRGEAE